MPLEYRRKTVGNEHIVGIAENHSLSICRDDAVRTVNLLPSVKVAENITQDTPVAFNSSMRLGVTNQPDLRLVQLRWRTNALTPRGCLPIFHWRP